MPYIYKMSNWPLFEWDSDYIAPLLSRLRYEQGLFARRCTAMNPKAADEALNMALINDAAASSALEGAAFDAKTAAKALKNKTGAIPGLLQVLLDINSHSAGLLTASRLFGWHRLVMREAPGSGAWRTGKLGDKKISYGPLGSKKLQYVAPKAEYIPAEMKNFLAWFNFDALPERPGRTPSALWQDPVIKAGIAHFWLISIHPFDDGSARLARAAANLALLRADGGKRFYSMDERILHEQKEYHNALAASQRGNLDITPWLDWFLHALKRTVHNAEKLIAPAIKRDITLEKMQKSALNSRQKTVLGLLLEDSKKQVSSGSYAEIASCSGDTALRDIQALIKLGLLRRNRAGGRSTSYSLKA